MPEAGVAPEMLSQDIFRGKSNIDSATISKATTEIPHGAPCSETSVPTVEAGEAAIADTAAASIADIANDLHCAPTKESILSKLKGYLDKGTKTDNRVEYMLDADTKIMFRKDFDVHGLSEKRGYPKRTNIDHYNIEIQVRRYPGTNLKGWDQLKDGLFHIVVDAFGNVTDFY